MYDFFYHFRFNVENQKLNIRIFLSLEDFFTPVYIRTFESLALSQEASFLAIYREIEEYLDNKNIVINEEDLNLLYETLNTYNIPMPQIISVVLNQYDKDLDEYDHVLTPKDIIFLNYLDGKAIDDKRFNFWEEENNLNTTYLTQELLKNKLITTSNYEYNLTKAKRENLLDIVELYELDVRGDNKDLIKMIENELSNEDVKKHFSGTHYTLTEKGKKVIERSKKIIDFDHSIFRCVHKLSVEEFHLLSIKKSDYYFNGIGRLLLVNNNSDQLKRFDWDSLKKNEINKDEEIIEVETVKDDEFIDYINKLSETYNQDETINDQMVQNKEHIGEKNINHSTEKEINKKKPIILDETEEVDIDEVYFDQDLINSEKLEAYRKKRESYEINKRGIHKGHLANHSNKKRKKHPVFKRILFIIIFMILLVEILYLIERFELVNLPFSVEDTFQSLKDSFNEYKNKVIDFIDYIKDYKSD